MKKVLFVLILLLSMSFMAVPGDALCEPVIIVLESPSETANVSANTSGTVSFSGYVYYNCGTIMSYDNVTINIYSELGANVSVTPSYANLTSANKRVNITITATYPPGTSSNTPDTITLNGTHTDGKIIKYVYSSKMKVDIAKYHIIEINASPAHTEISRGDQYFFNYNITNQGNGEDTYSLKIDDDNLIDLIEAGFNVYGGGKCVISSGDSKTLSFTGTTSNHVKEGTYKIILIVSSDNSGGLVTTSTEFTVNVTSSFTLDMQIAIEKNITWFIVSIIAVVIIIVNVIKRHTRS